MHKKCAKCKAQISQAATICPRCGADLQAAGGVENILPAAMAAVEDAPSFGRGAIGCLIPLLGLIFYIVDKPQRPKRAQSAGIGAAVGCGLIMVFLLPALLFPFFARARQTSRRAQCQDHLKQLGLATYNYTKANGNRLPNLSSPQAIRSALSSYVKGDVFNCPSSHGVGYAGNPMLSGKNHDSIPVPSQIIMLYDQNDVHLDGRNVLFADGHVKWLKPEGFELAKQASAMR